MDFEKFLAQFGPEVREAFRAALRDIVDNAILAQVVNAIERNDVEAAFRALGISPPVFNPIISVLSQTVNQAGLMMMAQMPKYTTDSTGIKTMLRFNIRDPRAERWIKDQSGTLITNIEREIRDAVRNTMQAGLAEGRNPRSVALDIVGRIDPRSKSRVGGAVGLNNQQEAWSRSFRTKLLTRDPGYFDMKLRDKRFDGIVQRAIDEGKPLDRETVDKLVTRYRDNALRFRGEQIARTETHQAMMYGEWLSVSQSLEQTDLPPDATVKIWDSREDGRTRHSHVHMDGQTRKVNEPFVSPISGAKMMYPGDTSLGATGDEVIACRCRVIYKTDFFAGVT